MFAIVEFDDGVQMVPMAWLRDDRKHCMWPPFTNQLKINKAISNLDPVSSEWKCHKVNRIFATTDNYEKGMSKLRLCEKFSDIDSSDKDESKLKKLRQERAKKIRNSSSSSSDEGSISNVLSFPPAPTNLLDRSCDVSVQKVSISQGPSHELNDISGTSSGPQTSKENVKEFQQFVVRKLNMIVLKLDMIEERIQLLETKVKGDRADNAENCLFDGVLPLRTLEQLNDLEQQISSPGTHDKLVQHLIGIGGTTLTSVTVNILKRLLVDSLAEQFSLNGVRQKKIFRELQLSVAVVRSARSRIGTASEQDILDIVGNWLKHAKTRRIHADGKRNLLAE